MTEVECDVKDERLNFQMYQVEIKASLATKVPAITKFDEIVAALSLCVLVPLLLED